MGCCQSMLQLLSGAAPSPALPRGPFSGRVGPVSTVLNYAPRDDKSHYRLGIQLKGMPLVLERIGFLDRKECHWSCPDSWKHYECLNWKYATNYQRPANMAWLNGVAGDIEVGETDYGGDYVRGDYGLRNVVGYDVCGQARRWLTENGHTEHSLCEVVLLDQRFEDLRKYIGLANLFYSHEQINRFLRDASPSDLFAIQDALEEGSKKGEEKLSLDAFIWSDFFSLRQATSDFQAEAIVELVREIGALLAYVDIERPTYMGRSFCVLEIFAAAAGQAKLFVYTAASLQSVINEMLDKSPVNSM